MIVFVGDVHGKWVELTKEISRLQIEDAVLIQVGDFGVGFSYFDSTKTALQRLNESLVKNNNHMYVFRGNHDDPFYFSKDLFKFSNLHFVSDYTLLKFKEADVFCVGGAISIDRLQRVKNVSYWENENVVWDKEKFNSISFDTSKRLVIATHTAPLVVNVNKNGTALVDEWAKYDSRLWDDINAERAILQLLHDELKQNKISFTDWFMGHFHFSMFETHGGNFHILDELEFKLLY